MSNATCITWARDCGMGFSVTAGYINVDSTCLTRLVQQRDRLLAAVQSIEAGNLDGETFEMFHDRARQEARTALRR